MAEGSANFGLMSLIATGGAGAFFGVRNKRWDLNKRISIVDEKIARMRRGEDITFTEEEAIPLATLISEEEMVLSSPSALELVRKNDARATIVEAVKAYGGLGNSSGIIRNINADFYYVQNEVIKDMKLKYPFLKFDIVNAKEGGYNIAFGVKGLDAIRRNIFKETGRFPGMLIQKGRGTYEYIGPASPKVNKKGETVVAKKEGPEMPEIVKKIKPVNCLLASSTL